LKGHPVCDQVLYHLEERAIEHAVIPWCEKHGLAVVAYSPFGYGQFPNPRTAGGRVLKQIAVAHNATPRQVALRFLVHQSPLFTIAQASNADHATESAGAGGLRLTEADVARIAEALPLGAPPRKLRVL
jgi:diketogulonate reductase-like aldo/keto reductase